jgi:hypothetical protein
MATDSQHTQTIWGKRQNDYVVILSQYISKSHYTSLNTQKFLFGSYISVKIGGGIQSLNNETQIISQ